MRINLNIERYDIKSLSDIYSTAEELRGQCRDLRSFGELMTRKAKDAHEYFDTINYERMKEALESFLKKMESAQEEFDELLRSCRQFAEKISELWS